MNHRRHLLIAAIASAFLWLPAAAQVKANATVTDVANYKAADREQKLIEGAKKEGSLDIYTSPRATTWARWCRVREEVRHQGERVALVQREGAAARRHRGARQPPHRGLCETNGPELEALSREKLLEKINSPYLADLIAPAIRPHGEWWARASTFSCRRTTRRR
jgi:iron(III) transport system substrate-binding protein